MPGESTTSAKGDSRFVHRRVANDNVGYTWLEFKEYYGDDAEGAWKNALRVIAFPADYERDWSKMMHSLHLNQQLMKPNVDPHPLPPYFPATELQRELLRPAGPPSPCVASASASMCGAAEKVSLVAARA